MLSPWGNGSVRAYYPPDMGGPFGSPSSPLPAYGLNTIYTGNVPYKGSPDVAGYITLPSCSFGYRQLTPGGVTTEDSWGYSYGKRRKSSRRSRRKSSRRRYTQKRRNTKHKKSKRPKKTTKR